MNIRPVCNNQNALQEYIEKKLTKSFYHARKTVASHGHAAPQQFDFENLNQALYWVKMVGAELNAPNGIELVLTKGTHLLTDDLVLGDGLLIPGSKYSNPLLFLRDIDLQITGAGTHETKILIENDHQSGLVFQNMRISFEQLSFGITSHIVTEAQEMRFVGSEAHINAVGFKDFMVHAEYGSVVKMSGRGGSAGMCQGFTKENHYLTATMNSFIHLLGFDFFEKEGFIEAFQNSYIYMYHCLNDDNLRYNIPKNKLSQDMSLIYDHNALGVYTTNLKYITHDDHAEIFNSAGDGFDIPIVTKHDIGLMTPEDKIKLDGLRPDLDTDCPFNFQIWETEAQTQGQTTFIIDGFSAKYIKVFSNGVLVRTTEYEVTRGYDEMTIVFKTPRHEADWIAVEYIL